MVKYVKISIKYTSKIKKGIKLYNHIYFNYWLNIQAIENKLMQCEIINLSKSAHNQPKEKNNYTFVGACTLF